MSRVFVAVAVAVAGKGVAEVRYIFYHEVLLSFCLGFGSFLPVYLNFIQSTILTVI